MLIKSLIEIETKEPKKREEYMRNISKKSVTFLLIALLVFVPFTTTAMAETTDTSEEKFTAMTIDILLVRPLGIVATAVGSAIFVVSLPFSALGGNVKEAGKTLVVEPFFYTFKRRLGEIDLKGSSWWKRKEKE